MPLLWTWWTLLGFVFSLDVRLCLTDDVDIQFWSVNVPLVVDCSL